MKTSESITKITQALVAARRTMTPAGRSGKNTFHGYEYATEVDWFEAVTPALLEQNLAVIFSVTDIQHLDTRPRRNTTDYPVCVKGMATLVHESGEWLEVEGYGMGQDDADKGVYKAITGLKKYLYSLLFALPTTTDPEAPTKRRGKSAEEPPKTAPTAQQYKAALKAIADAANPDDLSRIRARMAQFHWSEEQYSTLKDELAKKG